MNLSDIPTPLTDAAERFSAIDYANNQDIHCVRADFARDLERKLAESVADAKASEMMLRQVCEERDQLRSYAGSQTFRSDFRTADELRAAYDEERRKNAVLREALKNLVPLASIHQAQPEDMTETDFYNLIVALSSARAALATTEEKV